MGRGCLGLAVLVVSVQVFAQREWVMKQIDLPHPYYYREMYLPQLTTGPSSWRGCRTRAGWCIRWPGRCGNRTWDRMRRKN